MPATGGCCLIIAPHPDDETFGMGGVIASATGDRNIAPGNPEIHVVFLTSGGKSHAGCCTIPPSELEKIREKTAQRAMAIFGLPDVNVHFLRLADGKLPHPGERGFEDASSKIAELIRSVGADSVFAPHPFEGWSDHIAAEELTREAVRMAVRPGGGVAYYHYCVWFWFSMPLRRALRVDWGNAVTMDLRGGVADGETNDGEHKTPWEIKRAAMRVYLHDLAPCGKPTCGVLPVELLRAFEWKKELFFRADSGGTRLGGK